MAVWLQPERVATASTWVASLLALAVAWLWGENLRNRRARWAAMEERARRLEPEREERTRQAVTEERLRIARELHDVVAHSMSVIAVQAGVANHVIDARPSRPGRRWPRSRRPAAAPWWRCGGCSACSGRAMSRRPASRPSPGWPRSGRLAEQIRRPVWRLS